MRLTLVFENPDPCHAISSVQIVGFQRIELSPRQAADCFDPCIPLIDASFPIAADYHNVRHGAERFLMTSLT